MEIEVEIGEWIRVHVDPKLRRQSTTAHRVAENGQTACGILIGDRAAAEPPPPGFAKCQMCTVLS